MDGLAGSGLLFRGHLLRDFPIRHVRPLLQPLPIIRVLANHIHYSQFSHVRLIRVGIASHAYWIRHGTARIPGAHIYHLPFEHGHVAHFQVRQHPHGERFQAEEGSQHDATCRYGAVLIHCRLAYSS